MKHMKVQVVIISNEEKPSVLLLQTNKKRGEFWQNVTGSVEENEAVEQAAFRELEEETGLRPESLKSLPTIHQFHDRWNKEVDEYCFLAIVEKKEKIETDPKEHQGFKWVELDQVSKDDYGFEGNHLSFLEAVNVFARME